jgi:hypothetical protein
MGPRTQVGHGNRLQTVKDGRAVRLYGRNGREWTKRLARLAEVHPNSAGGQEGIAYGGDDRGAKNNAGPTPCHGLVYDHDDGHCSCAAHGPALEGRMALAGPDTETSSPQLRPQWQTRPKLEPQTRRFVVTAWRDIFPRRTMIGVLQRRREATSLDPSYAKPR